MKFFYTNSMVRRAHHKIATALAVSLVFGLTGPIVALAASPATVNLGASGNFVILAKTGISTTGSTTILGDIGLSPAAASYLTGFALTLPAASAFSTSALVTGKIYAPGYADPTPANLTTAVLDMQTAYTDAAGRAPTVTELGAGNIGGLTLASGVYKWGTGLTIPTDVTLSGGAQDVWIFQVAQNLSLSSATKIVLAGGAQANNIFWVVAGQTTLGTTSVFNGNILDQTAIVLNTGARLTGRALAQTAVTLDSNTVTMSTSVAPAAVSAPTPTPSSTPTPTPTYTPTPTPTPTQTQTPPPSASFGGGGPPASSDANVDVQTRLNGLLSALQSLKAQQAAQLGSSVSVQATPPGLLDQKVRMITINLTKGSRDSGDNKNVALLQGFLVEQNKGSAALALAQALAQPRTTSYAYFGGLTRAALAEFQKSVGITPASGYFGAKTRAYIHSSSQ